MPQLTINRANLPKWNGIKTIKIKARKTEPRKPAKSVYHKNVVRKFDRGPFTVSFGIYSASNSTSSFMLMYVFLPRIYFYCVLNAIFCTYVLVYLQAPEPFTFHILEQEIPFTTPRFAGACYICARCGEVNEMENVIMFQICVMKRIAINVWQCSKCKK